VELGARLQAIANQIGPYQSLADIGTDHAFLPVWLIQNGKIMAAVAGDIQTGPLEAAKRTVREAAIGNKVEVRLGDGLRVVSPGEVEVAVVAGMGGSTIRQILQSSPEVVRVLRRIVCQPMTGAAGLREWLLTNGWIIVAEDLVREDDRLYEIIVAEPGSAETMDALLLEIGPQLWRNRHPLLSEHLIRLQRQYLYRATAMGKSRSDKVSRDRQEILSKIAELEAKLKCLQIVE
jgi:tRNA (adenine22-N1)-methyltransferase